VIRKDFTYKEMLSKPKQPVSSKPLDPHSNPNPLLNISTSQYQQQ